MSRSFNFNVSILLVREEDRWVAQCLDYDIAAQGRSLSDVKQAFAKMFIGQILVDLHHSVEPLSTFSRAPEKYWKQFEHAERLADKQPFLMPQSALPSGSPYMVKAMASDLRIAA